MAKYTIVNGQGKVVSIIVWDGNTTWSPPAGHTVRPWQPSDVIMRPVDPRDAAIARAFAAIEGIKTTPVGKILYDLFVARS